MTAINVKVEKNSNENNTALIRRFTKRVQNSGILPRAKSIRFRNRAISETKKKQQTLKRLKKLEEREKLIKLGKIVDRSNSMTYRR